VTTLSKPIKVVIVLAVIVDLVTFSGVSLLKLAAMGVGMVMVLLGIAYSYRQPAAIGLLILSATAAASIELTTLLEIGKLLTAIVGLLVPVSILAWIALTSEEERRADEIILKRPIALASVYGLVCLLSIPIVVLIISLFNPGISMRTATMTEAAIVLITATLGGVVITMRSPAPTPTVGAIKEERPE